MSPWQQEISSLLNDSLSIEWFEETLELFEGSEYFDAKTNLITYPQLDRTTKKGDEFISQNFIEFSIHGVSIYNPAYSSKLEKANFFPRINIFFKLWQMGLADIKERDNNHNYRWIRKLIMYTNEMIDELDSTSSNSKYSSYLQDFTRHLNSFFLERFQIIMDEYEDAIDNSDRLEFDLTQDELAALLFLIKDFVSDVNSDKRKGKMDFHTFCNRYFYYSKGKGKDYAPIKTVSKKISEAGTGENREALNKVFESIREARRKTP